MKIKNKEKANKHMTFISRNHLHTLVTYFLLFISGLTIGITYSSYNENPYYPVSKYYNFNQVFPSILASTTTTMTTRDDQENEMFSTQSQSSSKCKLSSGYSDDEELLDRVLEVSNRNHKSTKLVPKIAFLFLTRGSLPLAPLWEKFFQGNYGLFTVYVHSNPSSNETVPEDSVFCDASIPSKRVDWGKFNMVEAERRLLANALLEPSNQRFVLLSESCIPLFNFSTIYSYLVNSKQTFVESYDLPGPTGRGRYSRRLKPLVNLEDWRKGSQWFEMDRNLATQVILAEKYFHKFRRRCRFAKCYGDEHYLATFVNMNYRVKNANTSLTWVDWSRGRHGHPSRFGEHVTIELLNKLRHGTECKYNGKITNTCFLFARKFSPEALDKLLTFAPKVMRF